MRDKHPRSATYSTFPFNRKGIPAPFRLVEKKDSQIQKSEIKNFTFRVSMKGSSYLIRKLLLLEQTGQLVQAHTSRLISLLYVRLPN
jgi:hypothetical protein